MVLPFSRVALCTLLSLCATTIGATSVPADSTSVGRTLSHKGFAERRAATPLIAWPAALGGGALLIAEGAVGRAAADNGTITPKAVRSSVVADVAQFAPLAALWACNIAGERNYSWAQSATSQAFGLLLDEGLLWTLKHSIHATRPDGGDSRSFPSGHTARAFFGATCFAIELGEDHPWAATATYLFATAVGAQRVLSERHFPVDVAAGAGLGMITAQTGYLLADLIFKRNADALRPEAATTHIDILTGLETRLSSASLGTSTLHFMPALLSAVSVGHALTRRWEVGASASLTSLPMRLNDNYAGCRNSVSLMVGPTLRLAETGRCMLSASLRGGYRFDLKHDFTEGLTTGSGGAVGAIGVRGAVLVRRHMTMAVDLGYSISSEKYALNGESRRFTANSLSLAVSSGILF